MILRPYQSAMAESVWAKHAGGTRDVLAVLPTGGGKTAIFSSLTAAWTGQGHYTCILVHRVELLNQASAALNRLGVEHGRIQPGRMLTRDRVQVASVDTLLARMSLMKEPLQRFTKAITDEAHHAVAGKWSTVRAAMTGAQGLGVTATPFRADGRGLGDCFQDFVQGPSVQELIDMGYLAPPRVYHPPVTVDLSSVRTRMGDYVTADLVKAVNTDSVTLPAVKWYQDLCDGQPAIAFCANVQHAHDVAKQFRAVGYNSAAIDGEMKPAERDQAIQDLGRGRLHVLTSCDIVSEGTDIPVVAAAIMLRPTESTGLYMQQGGRVLRPFPGKEWSTIIDVVGNTAKHGMLQAKRPWSLKAGVKGMERGVSATYRCRHCYMRAEVGPDACEGCGRSLERRHRMPTVAAPAPEFVPLTTDGLGAFSDEQIVAMPYASALKIAKTEAELQRVARVRGYKPGWAKHVMGQRADPRAAYGRRRW